MMTDDSSPAVVLDPLERLPAASTWLMRLWGRLTKLRLLGDVNLPQQGPVMLVGNHTLMGLYDTPLLLHEVHRLRGIVPRAMGDRVHFAVPGWSWLLRRHGAVVGSRQTCRQLLEDGAWVLVFPGGGREVSKRRGERYRLIWGGRRGFARLAIETGALVVPFSGVGAEDAWDIVYDADQIMQSRVGSLVRRLGIRPSVLLPVVRGLGPTPIPRLVELTFEIMPAIDPARYGTDPNDEVAVDALRDDVKAAIEAGLMRWAD